MAEPDDDIPVYGYVRCCECGALILQAWANLTGRRCEQCWKDRHPLATLEVINRSVRMSARQLNNTRKQTHVRSKRTWQGVLAREAARRRLSIVFPDVYAMLLDEERVKRGLHPIAHYDVIDFDKAVSKTLAFEDVYDALDSEGVNDA